MSKLLDWPQRTYCTVYWEYLVWKMKEGNAIMATLEPVAWDLKCREVNWILPKERNANRFFWDSHWLEIWVHSHAPSIRSHRGTKVVWPDFQRMRVPEEPRFVLIFFGKIQFLPSCIWNIPSCRTASGKATYVPLCLGGYFLLPNRE